MNKEVLMNKEVSDALHCLFHCARENKKIFVTQHQQFRLVYNYINQLEKEVERLKEREKLVTEHYDVMVRHAGNLEGKIIQLETNIDEAKEEIKDLLEHWKGNDLVERDLNILLSLLERGKE